MKVDRFQLKVAGNETVKSEFSGRVVGWKFEFFSCQPAPVSLFIGDSEYQITEGLTVPAEVDIRFRYTGDSASTASVLLVLEKV